MTFPPQCTKTWQLYEQMSRVLKMCEEAGFDRPWECVKYMGTVLVHFKPELVEFFLHFVEGRPVFRGDVLYSQLDGEAVTADEFVNWNHKWSWNPPQRTIEINGVKVKRPISVERSDDAEYRNHYGLFVKFLNRDDAEAAKAALEK